MPLALVVCGALGYAVERWLVRPLYQRPFDTLVVTWGLSLLLRKGAESIFGLGYKSLTEPIGGTVEVLGATYPRYRLLLIAVSVVVLGALVLWYGRSRTGTRIKAMVGNPELARALGIPVRRYASATFVVGTCLAGLAGVMIAPLVPVQPFMGLDHILMSFFVLVVGGLGSVGGLLTGSTRDRRQQQHRLGAQRQHRRLLLRAGCWRSSSSGCGHAASMRAASAAVLTLLLLPFAVGDFWAYQLGLLYLYAIAALGIGLCWGRAGFLPLGQGIFFGLAAYLSGLALIEFDGSVWLIVLLPLAACASGLLAFLIGVLVFRRRGESGPYFSMITLALSLLAYQVANNWESVTGGFNGLKGIPGLPGLDSYTAAYEVAAVALAARRSAWPGCIARRSACSGPRSPTTSAASCSSASTATG